MLLFLPFVDYKSATYHRSSEATVSDNISLVKPGEVQRLWTSMTQQKILFFQFRSSSVPFLVSEEKETNCSLLYYTLYIKKNKNILFSFSGW